MNSIHGLSIFSLLLSFTAATSPEACTVDDVVYEDGALVEGATYRCVGWGAAESRWEATEKRCRNGVVQEESYPGECANGWACCPVGTTAGCVIDWQHCEHPKTCTVDDKVYQDGEIIADVRHDCKDDEAFTITQEVCREGVIKEETSDGACDFGMCCQYGDFVGCTTPNCDVDEGKKECFFAGDSYPDGATIKVVGYTCPFWGAGASAVQVTENICRDGTITAETRDIPCDHGWICCQVGQSAMCTPETTQCPGQATASVIPPAGAVDEEIDAYGGGKKKNCYIDDEVYEHGESIRILSQTCGWGAAEREFTVQHEVCRKGKVKVKTYDGECESGDVCCQSGEFMHCADSCEEPKGRSCLFAGQDYQDGAVVDITGYTCPFIGAGAGELRLTETVCRDGTLTSETTDLPCGNGWVCCQVGRQAMCIDHWENCPETTGAHAEKAEEIGTYGKKSSSDSDSNEDMSCVVDGKEYENGEVIRDTKHECIGYHTDTAFAIFQEVCRDGDVKEESFDGECETGVCCKYGDFVGCTTPDCEVPKGRSCFFAGITYEDGDTIDIMGYTCPGRGAAQSRVIQTETVCRDGQMKVEEHNIPCANNWACCQIGKNAACMESWQSCPQNPGAHAEGATEEIDTYGGGKKKPCYIDDEVYEHGESIRILSQTCGWGAAEREFTVQHEVCRKGKVKVKTYDGECESGDVCCQSGEFMHCADSCEEPKGRSCLFAGQDYQDGAVVDITGYTCPFIGAGAGELRLTETVCRDGTLTSE
eukprot:212261_1